MSWPYKIILGFNGVYYVYKNSAESRRDSKLAMIKLGLDKKSTAIFPESAYCLSPNKLHLPFAYGIFDIARKSGQPIIPCVFEYFYDEEKLDGKKRIRLVKARYGSPIFVKENDSLDDKLNEYSAWISKLGGI